MPEIAVRSIASSEPSDPQPTLALKTLNPNCEAEAQAHLVYLVDLDGGVGDDIEGLEIDPAESDHHPARLAGQGGDAVSDQLQEAVLAVILKPAHIENLVLLMFLLGSKGL